MRFCFAGLPVRKICSAVASPSAPSVSLSDGARTLCTSSMMGNISLSMDAALSLSLSPTAAGYLLHLSVADASSAFLLSPPPYIPCCPSLCCCCLGWFLIYILQRLLLSTPACPLPLVLPVLLVLLVLLVVVCDGVLAAWVLRGQISEDHFSLDFSWPLSPLQAFVAAMSIFDG